MNFMAGIIDAMKRTRGNRGKMRHMVTVVRKSVSGVDCRAFTYYFFAFDDGGRSITVGQDPFPSQEGDLTVAKVVYAYEVNKSVQVGTLHC